MLAEILLLTSAISSLISRDFTIARSAMFQKPFHFSSYRDRIEISRNRMEEEPEIKKSMISAPLSSFEHWSLFTAKDNEFSFRYGLAGAISGVLQKSLVQPLDLIKTRMQVMNSDHFHRLIAKCHPSDPRVEQNRSSTIYRSASRVASDRDHRRRECPLHGPRAQSAGIGHRLGRLLSSLQHHQTVRPLTSPQASLKVSNALCPP